MRAGRRTARTLRIYATRITAAQARRRLGDIARDVPLEPVAAVRASRGTTRLFLVAATESHAGYLTERFTALTVRPWAADLRVYWS